MAKVREVTRLKDGLTEQHTTDWTESSQGCTDFKESYKTSGQKQVWGWGKELLVAHELVTRRAAKGHRGRGVPG